MSLNRPAHFKEEDLYEPVRKWLVNNGYDVQAEVVDCDIIGMKDDVLHLIELKKSFSLKLVYQCLERQKISDHVYAAIPIPKGGKRSRSFKDAKTLCKRIGLGLLAVHLYERNSLVELICEPEKTGARKNPRRQAKVKKEIANRSGDYNTGGHAGKVTTAYREASIFIYLLLQESIEASPAQLKRMGAPPNTGAILRDNHYGWFHKISRGIYTFDVDREVIASAYPEVVSYYRNLIAGTED